MAKTEIKSEISLSTTKFQRGLAKSQKGINNFAANAIRKFGAIAGAAGLGMLARSAIDLGSKISDMAVQMNIGTDQLQTLEFAAREAGVGVDIMARALRNVQLRTEEAINGNKSYGDAFTRLGINIKEFKKLNVEKKMEAIAIAQSKATDKAAAYNAVSRILGEKAGPALQEVLQKLAGPQGYGGLEAAAKRAGEVMSKETIAKMDAAADKIESFKRRMTVMAGEVLAKVIPAFQMFFGGLGSVSDMFAMLTGKSMSFFGFLSRSLNSVMGPAVKSFAALAKGAEAAGLAMKGNVIGARKAAQESVNLAKKSFKTLKDVPDAIGENWKRATEEMEIDSAMFEDSTKVRAANMKKAWSDMTGGMVGDTKKAADEINDTEVAPGSTAGTSGKPGANSQAAAAKGKTATSSSDTPTYRKFGESLAKFDPTSGERRKMGDSFKHLNVQRELSDAQGGTSAKKESAETDAYAKSSADSLKVIESELTRSS